MKKCCRQYNGTNANTCINSLLIDTKIYMSDLNLDGVSSRFIQYIIAYYDFISKSIKLKVYEIIKDINNIKIINLEHFINTNFFAFETYAKKINDKYKYINEYNISNTSLKNKVFKTIYQNYDFDIKNIDNVNVAGPIQWASISLDGTIQYGIKKEAI